MPTDTRFAVIEDAVTLLKQLPRTEQIAWPADPGDDEVTAEALKWLTAWVPAANRAYKRHRSETRQAARAARNGDRTSGGRLRP